MRPSTGTTALLAAASLGVSAHAARILAVVENSDLSFKSLFSSLEGASALSGAQTTARADQKTMRLQDGIIRYRAGRRQTRARRFSSMTLELSTISFSSPPLPNVSTKRMARKMR